MISTGTTSNLTITDGGTGNALVALGLGNGGEHEHDGYHSAPL